MSREFFEKEPETIEWINNFKVFNDKKIIFGILEQIWDFIQFMLQKYIKI